MAAKSLLASPGDSQEIVVIYFSYFLLIFIRSIFKKKLGKVED